MLEIDSNVYFNFQTKAMKAPKQTKNMLLKFRRVQSTFCYKKVIFAQLEIYSLMIFKEIKLRWTNYFLSRKVFRRFEKTYESDFHRKNTSSNHFLVRYTFSLFGKKLDRVFEQNWIMWSLVPDLGQSVNLK